MATATKKKAEITIPPDPLHLSEQTIETLHDPAYWRACCPFLTCERDSAADAALAAAAAAIERDCVAEAAAVAAAAAAKLEAAAAVTAAAAAFVAVAASPGVAMHPATLVEATAAVSAATAAASLAAVASVTAAVATPEDSPVAAAEPAVAIAAAAAAVAVSEAAAAAAAAALRGRLATFGFFKLPASTLGLDATTVAALGRGALRLIELGHSPSALLAYDEVWALSAAVNATLAPLTGNAPTGDYYTFVVAPGRHEFAGPHRDKPAAGGEPPSFRGPGRAPGFVTAWLALTPATPESSCLSFVPACDDAGYLTPGDALQEVRGWGWGGAVCDEGRVIMLGGRCGDAAPLGTLVHLRLPCPTPAGAPRAVVVGQHRRAALRPGRPPVLLAPPRPLGLARAGAPRRRRALSGAPNREPLLPRRAVPLRAARRAPARRAIVGSRRRGLRSARVRPRSARPLPPAPGGTGSWVRDPPCMAAPASPRLSCGSPCVLAKH